MKDHDGTECCEHFWIPTYGLLFVCLLCSEWYREPVRIVINASVSEPLPKEAPKAVSP